MKELIRILLGKPPKIEIERYPKPGELWRGRNDPFDPPLKIAEVKELKDGWVRYGFKRKHPEYIEVNPDARIQEYWFTAEFQFWKTKNPAAKA